MGIRHAGRRNIEYILLQNKKIGEIVSIDNVQYTVQTIIDRYIHAFQFAINIWENSENALAGHLGILWQTCWKFIISGMEKLDFP